MVMLSSPTRRPLLQGASGLTTLSGKLLVGFDPGHPFSANFWEQLLNSLLVASVTCGLVLFIASTTSFALGRLRLKWTPMISNMALFTYLIPSAFLAIPLYRVMGL
jgi:multiple sugar transport system permease protein